MSVLAELRRRNVFRVGMLYIAGAWVVLQVADVLADALPLPGWSLRAVLALLVLGFPLALTLAWAFELTPQGVRRDPGTAAGSGSPGPGWRADVAVFLLLVALVGILAAERLLPGGDDPGEEVGVRASAERPAQSVSPGRIPPRSIAVLPFANLSPDADNDYFSEGLAEELLNLLSRVPDLHVAARTSAFSFRDQRADVATIGRQLGVAHLLEGSVRKAGSQVRVTVRLVDARSGFQLWAGTWNRSLGDIFAVQDEIATAVMDTLKIRFLENQRLRARVTHPQAYALYLEGRHLGQQHTEEAYAEAAALLARVLEIDPGYPPAWVALARVRLNQATQGLVPTAAAYEEAESAAEKALALEPRLPEAHAVLGWLAMYEGWDFADAHDHFWEALDQDPVNLSAQANAGTLAQNLCRMEEAISMKSRAIARDPRNIGLHNNLAIAYWFAGDLDQAEAAVRRALALRPSYLGGHLNLGLVLLARGQLEAALAEVEQESLEAWRLQGLAMVYHDMGRAAESDAALARLAAVPDIGGYLAAAAHAWRGDRDAAFAALEAAYRDRVGAMVEIKCDPAFAGLRDDPRWEELLRRIGLDDASIALVGRETPGLRWINRPRRRLATRGTP